MSFPASYREQLLSAVGSIDTARVAQAIEWMSGARDTGRSIFVAGNGGSAATAAHFVCDMVKGASFPGPARFKIVALGQNLPTSTAYANDLSYADALVEELKNFAQAGDVYMAISGSGNSPNVLRAVEWANRNGVKTFGCTGFSGGKLRGLAHQGLHVPLDDMGIVESVHLTAFHWVVDNLYKRIGLGQ